MPAHSSPILTGTPALVWLTTLALVAVVFPVLLAFNLPPSATFFNQAIAVIAWSLLFAALSVTAEGRRTRMRGGLAALVVALVVVGLATVASLGWASLPLPLGMSALGSMSMALLAAIVGATVAQSGRGEAAFHALCVALVAAGAFSAAVGIVQVFFPDWADGTWIASSPAQGRASGNLRQPNHLSSLLLWSLIAALWLREAGRMHRAAGTLLAIAFVFVLVLAASRTGAVGVVLLALWGVLDRRLSRWTRALLFLIPIGYLVFFGGLSLWAHASEQVFGGEARLSESTGANSRLNIWANTVSLVARSPWLGVGFGEFNFAWSLTPFPQRPTAFFDHAHNLPLHLAVELGVPLAALVILLLVWALWRAFAAGCAAPMPQATFLRSAFMLVLMIGVHSLFEYPLWYAYFLVPTAFAWGICLGADAVWQSNEATRSRWTIGAAPLMVASLLMLGGGIFSVFDYLRVSAIFTADEGAPPLAERIADGQRGWFFAHHADYAAATIAEQPSTVMPSFKVATHYLLDTRLMMAWATALHESGDTERARYLAARLREFRNPDSVPFFAPCDEPGRPDAEKPFQCFPPTKNFSFEDFR